MSVAAKFDERAFVSLYAAFEKQRTQELKEAKKGGMAQLAAQKSRQKRVSKDAFCAVLMKEAKVSHAHVLLQAALSCPAAPPFTAHCAWYQCLLCGERARCTTSFVRNCVSKIARGWCPKVVAPTKDVALEHYDQFVTADESFVAAMTEEDLKYNGKSKSKKKKLLAHANRCAIYCRPPALRAHVAQVWTCSTGKPSKLATRSTTASTSSAYQLSA